MTEAAIVSKIWNLENVMRHDRVGHGDYLEQNIKESLEEAEALRQSILKKTLKVVF